MEFLNQGIKAIITRHPEVGRILEEFKVGCTTCGVGTCLLGDIVGIHNLSLEDEAELMFRIEKTIYPHKNVTKPEIKKRPTPTTGQKYSPPLQVLVDEHKVIKRWLALIPRVIAHLDQDPDTAWAWIEQGLELIRRYADQYHHAKEEDILFKFAQENMEIIQVMYADHSTGRNHAKGVEEAMGNRDKQKAVHHLLAYRELLTEHIRKEDEILYPWIDRGLSDTQVGKMYAQFLQADADSGSPEKYLVFVNNLEAVLGDSHSDII